jgi:hypothetical protein
MDVRTKERKASVGGYVPEYYRRGVNLRDKVSGAHIAQAEMKEARQNVRELLLICNDDHQNTLQEIDLIGRMIKRGMENGVDTNEFGARMGELMGTLKSIQKRKESLCKENDKLMKEGNKRQIEALYEQVGSFEKKKSLVLLVLSMWRMKMILLLWLPNLLAVSHRCLATRFRLLVLRNW